MKFANVNQVQQGLAQANYIASKEIATCVYLAQATQKPILVEGPAGVGKTELAKAIAKNLDRELLRLQCYEGLDEAKALYEWEYAKQLLYTQMVKDKINEITAGATDLGQAIELIASQEDAFFSERFILPRPLLKAISSPQPVVLLIDEVDKADPEFEAFLLEILSDFQVSIPEIGLKKAKTTPFVLLTSNNYRDMSDALKRRCLYLYIDYPPPEVEMEIIKLKLPHIGEILLSQLVEAVRQMRKLNLKKKPCISESLDWARSLLALNADQLSPELASQTLSVVLKYQSDTQLVKEQLGSLIGT